MRSFFPFRQEPEREWVGGRYAVQSTVREGRSLFNPDLLLWLELPRGIIVSSKLVDPRGSLSFAQSLEDAMKNPGDGSPRKPSRIRVSDPRLADELRNTIGSDMPVTVAPVPELDHIFAEMERAMAGDGPLSYLDRGLIPPDVVGRTAAEELILPDAATHPLHELDNLLSVQIVAFGIERFGFDARDKIEVMFSDDESMLQIAVPWLAYCERFDGRPLSEWFLDAEGQRLRPLERRWLEAQGRAWLSVWEVVEVEPGRGLLLADLLTGERRFVHEVSGSLTARPRGAMLTRVVDFDGESLICGMYPMSLDPQGGAVVVSSFRRHHRLKKIVSPKLLRDLDTFTDLLDLWEDAIEQAYTRAEGRELRNSDGDPFIHTKEQYTFRPADRDEVMRRISLMEWAKAEEGTESAFIFARPLPRSDDLTMFARITLSKKRLDVETNSVARADEMRRRLGEALGELARFHVRTHEDPLSSSRSIEHLPGKPADPEHYAMLVQLKEQYYERWLDDSIPGLKGKTPRQVANGRASKEPLIEILKTIEYTESLLDPAQRFDVTRLYKALGLTRS